MTPEAAAEEMYPILEDDSELLIYNLKYSRTAFIAGHKSRDLEVERLVDILRNLVDAIEDDKMRISFNHVWKYTEAKELLKKYEC